MTLSGGTRADQANHGAWGDGGPGGRDEYDVIAHPLHRASGTASWQPAVLGGTPSFVPGLPFARPRRPDLDRVMERLRPSYERGLLTNGTLVVELEQRIAERLGVAHVVAVSSCTSGLMLAVQAVVDGRPGPVVLPSFTFSASGHSVVWNDRAPRFVENDPATFQIDLDHLAQNLEGASAVLATHIFGAPCDPHALEDLARSAGVPVLYDAAHALGAVCDGRPVGGFGVAEIFSLTPTKVMVAGEGGLVATNNDDLAERLRIGRDYGNPGNYDTRFVGLNARMSEMHAAIALESLELLDDSLARRQGVAERYQRGLADVPGLRCQVVHPTDESTYKDFTVAVDTEQFGLGRDQLVEVLAVEGIDTRNYFDPPVHRQESYARYEVAELPVADATSAGVVSLPIYPDLPDEAVDRVIDVVCRAHDAADEIERALRRPGRVPVRQPWRGRASVG